MVITKVSVVVTGVVIDTVVGDGVGKVFTISFVVV